MKFEYYALLIFPIVIIPLIYLFVSDFKYSENIIDNVLLTLVVIIAYSLVAYWYMYCMPAEWRNFIKENIELILSIPIVIGFIAMIVAIPIYFFSERLADILSNLLLFFIWMGGVIAFFSIPFLGVVPIILFIEHLP